VDWCSGLTYRLGLFLGVGAAGSIPGSAFVFCGGENVCVHSLHVYGHWCAHSIENLHPVKQAGITEGFKLCWRTGQKLTLKPFYSFPVSPTFSFLTFTFSF